jgi:hypothetical protein
MDSHSFVFVTGIHRSGASPLHRCLRCHPKISGFANTGVSEDEGQHLQTVLRRGGAYGGPGRFARHPDVHMTEAHTLATPQTAAQLFTQWSPYWDLSKPYLIEKTPITLVRTRLFQALFPHSYFVAIVRHPASVALATYNALASSGTKPDLTIADLIENWLIAHERFVADASFLRRVIVVKYEEFAARPQPTLDVVYEFLGLDSWPCGEEIEPDVNRRYLAQWETMRRDPQHRDEIEQALGMETHVRHFGYSLEDWSRCDPPPVPTPE